MKLKKSWFWFDCSSFHTENSTQTSSQNKKVLGNKCFDWEQKADWLNQSCSAGLFGICQSVFPDTGSHPGLHRHRSFFLLSEAVERGLECVVALEVSLMAPLYFILAAWLQKLQSGVVWMWICSSFTTSTRFVLDVRAAGCSCVRSPTSHGEILLGRNAIFSLPRFPGRAPETEALGLDKLGVQLNQETGKIVVGEDESTSVPHIYAFGDIGEVRSPSDDLSRNVGNDSTAVWEEGILTPTSTSIKIILCVRVSKQEGALCQKQVFRMPKIMQNLNRSNCQGKQLNLQPSLNMAESVTFTPPLTWLTRHQVKMLFFFTEKEKTFTFYLFIYVYNCSKKNV